MKDKLKREKGITLIALIITIIIMLILAGVSISIIKNQGIITKSNEAVEKYNQSAEGAIAQIKEKRYVESLKDYQGNLLLVGINYDKETKKHSCVIEKFAKGGWNHDSFEK